MNKGIRRGTVIQVTKAGEWFGCLMTVDEPKDFGCQAYMSMYGGGFAFLRLNHEDYEVIGKAVLDLDDEGEMVELR